MAAPNSTDNLKGDKQPFVAWLGHELRNPLAAIMSAVQVLRSNQLDDAIVHELYETIWRQSNTMHQILNQLPHIARNSAYPLATPAFDGDDWDSPSVPAEVAELQAESKKLRILVIDDQRDVRMPAERLLTQAGFDVATAATGQAGLEMAERTSPDVVLCDISLPDMSGYEVIRRMQDRGDTGTNPTLWIAVTGYDQESDRQMAHSAGFQQFLTKPIDFASLAQQLERYGSTGRVDA